jgi:hypothetical protein
MRRILEVNQDDWDYSLVDRWVIQPRIRLEGDNLVFDPVPRDPKRWKWAERPTARLLWDFAELAQAGDTEILEFAKKWGVLALCRPHLAPAGLCFTLHARLGRIECPPCGTEPLGAWRNYALLFNRELNQVQKTRSAPQMVAKVAWDVSRIAVAFGQLRPVLVQTETGELGLRIGGARVGSGLPTALGYQLLVLMAGRKRSLICAECGVWFESETPRGLGRKAYCQRCGRAAAVRAASRRYYENHKSRKREDKDGTQTQRG